MKITEAIEEFKTILKIFKTDKYCNTYLCNNTSNEKFKNLFNLDTYYRNYVWISALRTPNKISKNDEKVRKWKINFMKQEIKELTILLKQGYTDI